MESELKKDEDLLKSGVDVNFKDRDSNAALHCAVECGNVKAIELFSKGASAENKNNKDEGPLDKAKSLSDQHIIDTLGPPTPLPSRNDKTPKKETKSEPSVCTTAPDSQKNNRAQTIETNTLARRKNAIHGTEIQEAEKFDDLVFEYDVNGQQVYRLLQAKHRLDESMKITSQRLLMKDNGDYSLVKYFFSFLALKKNHLFNKGIIKDVTICTNIDFDFKNLQSNGINVEKIVEKDEILDVKSEKNESARYKFSGDIVQKLKSKVQNCTSSKKTDDYTDNDITEFIDRLVFAVNQPNEDKLGNILKQELSQEFNFITVENVYNKFFMSMLNWLQGKEKGIFLSYEDGKEFFVEFNRNVQVWFGVKSPVDSFSGRSEFLNNLHKILNTEKATNGKSRFVCVSGLGGVGKTELARKYISAYSQEYDNKIIWINAERYETLADSFRRLARDKLKISTVNADKKEKKLNSVVEDVYTFFSDKNCLFIFDNAEKYKSQHEFDDGVGAFLPRLPDACNKMHVLITSRYQKWPRNVEVVLLDVFSESEASEFVKQSLNLKDNDQTDEIKKLVNELQFLPLALQQAVAYIGYQDRILKNVGSEFKISQYMNKLKQKTKEYFKFPSDDENDYSKTIYSTWNITLDSIRQKENGTETCEILEILSYFAPAKISVQAIEPLIKDKLKLASAIDLLKQYSIIDVKHGILSLHRLVIKVIILQLEDRKREQEILHKALNLFRATILTSENIEHAMSVWNHSSKFCKLIEEFSSLAPHIIEMLLKIMRFEEAELFGIKALEQLRALLSKSDAIKLTLILTTNYVALALEWRGKYKSAAEYYENVYEMQNSISVPTSSKKGLSRNLMKLGQYDRALTICEEIIEVENKTIGRNHLYTSDTLYEKACILFEQDKFEESLSILNEVLSIRELNLGKTHSETLHIKSQIATTFLILGKQSEAEKIQQELSVQEVTDDLDLSNKIQKKLHEGSLLHQKEKFKETLSVIKEAHESNKILGDDHPFFLQFEHYKAIILRDTGELDESLKILKNIYEKQKKILGPDNPDTLLTVEDIGVTLYTQKKFSEALKILQDSLEKCKTIFGQKHSSTMRVIDCIAGTLMNLRKHDESYASSWVSHMTKYRREILEFREKQVGKDHEDYINTKYLIAVALCASGQLDEASEMYREIYSKKEYLTLSDNISWKENWLKILISLKKFEEALKIGKEILDAQEITIGKRHKETYFMKVTIASLLLQQNKNYSSFKILREILDTADDEILNYLGIQKLTQMMQTAERNINTLVNLVINNHYEKLQKTFDEGHEVNTASKDGTTILHYTARTGKTRLVEILLQNGADVTLVRTNGNTGLHEAATNGSLNIIKLLLKYGSMYNVRNKEGAIPLDLCKDKTARRFLMSVQEIFEDAAKGHAQILEKLKKLQSDELEAIQKTRNNRGRTFLQVIFRRGHGFSLMKR